MEATTLPETHKMCSVCKKSKKFRDFYKDRRNNPPFASTCKVCSKERSKRFYEEKPEYRQMIRNGGLKHRFGITQFDYFEMLKEQEGVCAICKLKYEKHLHVDHDHETGEIRGLLCKQCNHGLGNFKDNPTYLKNAIEYLD